MALLDDLERLAQLRERGMLTDEEFQSEKQKLLAASLLNNVPPSEPAPQPNQPWHDPTPTVQPEQHPPASVPPEVPYSPPGPESHVKEPSAPTARKVLKKEKKGSMRGMLAGALALISLIILIAISSRFIGSDFAQDTLRDAVIMRPEPVVVTNECDDEKASLFEYRVTVRGIVRNIGAEGYISVDVVAIQDGKEFIRHDRRYMRKDEEWKIEKIFDEPEASDGDVRCRIDVRADN